MRFGEARVALVAGLVLAGCSGGGSSDGATEDALRASVEAQVTALARSDIDAMWEHYTAACREAHSEQEFQAMVLVAMELAEGFGMDFSKAEPGPIEIRDLADGRAEVKATILVDGEPSEDDNDFQPYVYEDGAWRNADCSDLSGDDADSPTTTVARTGPGTRAEPLPVGEQASVGDWEVTVTSVDLDADAEVAAANELNDPPRPGNVYAAVRLAMTYRGEDDGDPSFAVRVNLVGADQRQYDGTESFATAPAPALSDANEVFAGGTAEGWVVIELPADQAAGAELFVEPLMTFDDDKVWWRTT